MNWNNEKVHIVNQATVTLPIQAGKTVDKVIYLLPEIGAVEVLSHRLVDGYVVFDVITMGMYGVMYDKEMTDNVGTDNQEPNNPNPNDQAPNDSTPDAQPLKDMQPQDQPNPNKDDSTTEAPSLPQEQEQKTAPNKSEEHTSSNEYSTSDKLTKESVQVASQSNDSLVATGEKQSFAILGTAIMAILSGLGLVHTHRKQED